MLFHSILSLVGFNWFNLKTINCKLKTFLTALNRTASKLDTQYSLNHSTYQSLIQEIQLSSIS